MAGPARKTTIVLGAVALLLVGIPLGAWLARGAIATSLLRDELAQRGIDCDDRFAVELGATLETLTVAPTRCTPRAPGIVEALELVDPLEIPLEGFEVGELHAGSMRLILRDQEVRGGSSWASALRRLSLEQRVAGLIKGLSELSTMGLPPTDVTQLEVIRGGGRVAVGHDLTLRPGASTAIGARQITMTAGPGGIGQLTLSEVRGTATRPRVQLAGRANATAGLGILSVSRGGPFTLDAEGLDTASPRFRLGGNF